jgi:hypothetical protein
VLINNIAWGLRHLPVFGVFGSGDYRLQPIYVDDLAAAATRKALEAQNEIVNAIGPETFRYLDLVRTIGRVLGVRYRVVRVPPGFGYWACRGLGLLLRDVLITREEIQGLMQERLYVDAPPLGTTRLTDWLQAHQETLGCRYTSEMARRTDRSSHYRSN